MNYAQTFLMVNMNAFPPETLPVIKEELERLDDESVTMLMMADIKNPVTALLLSIFLGELGVDRFYIGNKELGIAKLALTVIGYVTLFIVIGFFLLLGVYIWKLVDCFLIMKACKQANFERLMWQLNQAKTFQQARAKAAENVKNRETESARATVMPVATGLVEEMPLVSEEVVAVSEAVESEAMPIVDEEEVSEAIEEVVAIEETILVGEEEMSEEEGNQE